MRIHFTSSVRPERIAKAMRRELARLGHALPYARVREAVAAMYGYRSWNDLLGQAGTAPPSPSDTEAGPAIAAERRTAFSERLASALGLPASVAEAAVDGVGPTGRGGKVPWDLEAALRRIARYLTAPGSDCRLDGNTVSVTEDLARDSWADSFAIKADGSLSGLGVELIGSVLQRAGLTRTGDAPEQEIPQALRRLDPTALRLLRTIPGFHSWDYDFVRGLPKDTPFERLVDSLPMLASELCQTAAHRLYVDSSSETLRREHAPFLAMRERMLASDDPLGAYLDIVADYVANAWPGLPFDRNAAAHAVRTVAAMEVPHPGGLTPGHVAFLSYAPRARLPATPDELGAALRFIERESRLFRPYFGMAPGDFYGEVGAGWHALEDACNAADTSLMFLFADAALAITRMLLDRSGRHTAKAAVAEDLSENRVVRILANRVRQAVLPSKGFLELAHLQRGFNDPFLSRAPDEPAKPVTSLAGYSALRTSGLLPDWLSDADPEAVTRGLGIDPDAYVAALLDESEASVSEIEARITRSAAKDFAPHGHGDDLYGTRVFHASEVEGTRFRAMLGDDGPILEAVAPDGFERYVAFDSHTRIRWLSNQDYEGWAIPGPGEPIGIRLGALPPGGVQAVASEFGLTTPDRMLDFRKRPAFRGLARYAGTHPRAVAWHAGAIAARAVPLGEFPSAPAP